MIKVFEDFDIALVGLAVRVGAGGARYRHLYEKSVLTSGTGEIPFVEAVPQLWVLNDADGERAISRLKELREQDLSAAAGRAGSAYRLACITSELATDWCSMLARRPPAPARDRR